MAGIAHWDISAELFDSLSYPLGLVVVVIVLLESNSALAAAFRHCLLYVRWTGVLERMASWGALACSLQRVPCVLVVNVCVLGVVVLAAVTSGCVRVRGLANRLLPWRLKSVICLTRLWRDVGVVAVVGVVVVVGDVGGVVGVVGPTGVWVAVWFVVVGGVLVGCWSRLRLANLLLAIKRSCCICLARRLLGGGVGVSGYSLM